LTINFIEEKLKKHVLDLPDFMQELKDLPIWIIPTSLEENTGSRNPDFMDFIRGFVPYNLKFFFKQHLPSTFQSESITELILSSQSVATNNFKKWVWTFRNDALKIHQRSQGLNKRVLKRKFRNRDRSLDIPTQRHHTNHSTPIEELNRAINRIVNDRIDFGLNVSDVL